MLQKKKKLTKKAIKEDKLVKFFYQVESSFEQYKSKIVTYGLVLVVIVAAAYFYLNQKSEENLEASTELGRVMNLYSQGSYLEAIEGRQGSNIIGLKKIVDEYGSTENGETAKIFLANCYSYLGNYDEAIKYFEDYSGSIDYYKATALAGEAGNYASKGEFEKAAEKYLNASRVSELNAENADYLLNAGIYFLKTGEKDEAENLFTQVKEKYPTSTAGREVEKYLPSVN